jgi:hypothetical protein
VMQAESAETQLALVRQYFDAVDTRHAAAA